ncbi:class I SAM-dependent methyltransferase [Nocardiopsis sp. NPDC007018]|uniref:class I SAM-dependent DNA methyltransferase n=1 Tax=Nocardiopsis sp. NPDC007018 TaxID=3155721 RepID=UPI003404CB0D
MTVTQPPTSAPTTPVSATTEPGRTEYSGDHAEVYDVLQRARGRGRVSEADQITEVIRRFNPSARSVLDVACGTGTHIVGLRGEFDDVEGLELSEPMRARAMAKSPDAVIHAGDMFDFALGRTYDAITCLCFVLGYSRSLKELEALLSNVVAHLAPGGVFVAEPWWFLENAVDIPVAGALAEEPERVISRLSSIRRDGHTIRLELRYTIAEPSGIREFTEVEEMHLYSKEEHFAAFRRAGLEVRHLEGPPNGRGLLVGTLPR